jgi:hypothetical protein
VGFPRDLRARRARHGADRRPARARPRRRDRDRARCRFRVRSVVPLPRHERELDDRRCGDDSVRFDLYAAQLRPAARARPRRDRDRDARSALPAAAALLREPGPGPRQGTAGAADRCRLSHRDRCRRRTLRGHDRGDPLDRAVDRSGGDRAAPRGAPGPSDTRRRVDRSRLHLGRCAARLGQLLLAARQPRLAGEFLHRHARAPRLSAERSARPPGPSRDPLGVGETTIGTPPRLQSEHT